jgi:Protein of unknown function (DUF2851)
MHLTEDLLHYLWKFRLFNNHELKTADGEILEIISTGIHNKHAGPDFENAKIHIGQTLWAGNVEIHLRSSDWSRHQHQYDKAYNNVILHVVYQHDQQILRTDGTEIPVLVVENLIPPTIANNYTQLMQGLNWIPCEKLLVNVDSFHVKNWLSRVLIERLEEKTRLVNARLTEYKGSWDDAFYIIMARNFGFKVNAVPFELLARALPQQILAKHKNNPLQIEALIFGQAGFLNENQAINHLKAAIYSNKDIKDEYAKKLKREYQFLQKKYKLTSVDKYIWKYMRLRPQNFPTIRLAQFAALIIKSSHLFSKILEIKDVKMIKKLFYDLPVNVYWHTHYRFDAEASGSSTQLGEQSVNNILINTVAVFLFAYGKSTDDVSYINRAMALLENVSAEANQIINRFKQIGIESDKAYASQALLQLKKTYCDEKKCLHCGIGIKLINQA